MRSVTFPPPLFKVFRVQNRPFLKGDSPVNDKQHHLEVRERQARQGYINWRMLDLPSVYQDLMPYSCMAKELWEAENAIRKQYAIDQEAAKSPWRKIGPLCGMLDYTGMSGNKQLEFAIEVSIPIGMEDQPKPGSIFANKRASNDQISKALQAGRLTPGETDFAMGLDIEKAKADHEAKKKAKHKPDADAESGDVPPLHDK